MRVNDVKQILWWLSGGLVICIGVLVAVMFFLKPSRPHWPVYARYGEQQLTRARKMDRDRRTASRDFRKTYGATFSVKIDGTPPPLPVEPIKPVEEEPERRDFKLAEFIDVVALWTDVAFYRLKRDTSKVEEVEVGENIPAEKVPEIEGKAKLVRIEFKESPFRAVFDVNGKEEIFLIAQEAVMLARRQPAEASAEEYRGPDGGVTPMGRTVAAPGIREKDGEIIIGTDVREILNNDYNRFLKDVAWDVAPKGGIAVVKIRKGSRFDLLNGQAGGLIKEGDVIVSVGGVKVQSKSQIINHFKKNPVPAGQKLNVVISRYGRTINKVFTVPKR
jgi:hypothetical protein